MLRPILSWQASLVQAAYIHLKLLLGVVLQIDDAKTPILVKAADRLLAGGKFEGLLSEMKQFAKENSWCEDSAVFHALTHHNEATKDKGWWTWEGPLRCAGIAAILCDDELSA